MSNPTVLAYIITDSELRRRATAYPFRDEPIAPNKVAFALFEQIQGLVLARLKCVAINSGEVQGVAITLGKYNSEYEPMPKALKEWGKHYFGGEPRVFTKKGEHWYGPKKKGEGMDKVHMGCTLMRYVYRSIISRYQCLD